MDLQGFGFERDALLGAMRRWVMCESPSWDGAAVSRMVALAAGELRAAGAAVRTIAGRDGYGDCALGDFAPDDPRPGILVLGHLDTVHPLGSLAGPMPWREADGRCFGPGLFDMKSGNVMALAAIRAVRAAGLGHLPVRVLFTSDEESGSPSARGLIEDVARGQTYVLVPEGAQPNGNLAVGRYPSCRLRVWTHGRPSHALLQRDEGRSSLAAMARVILAVEALNGGDTAYTVTYVSAGRTVATVPMESYAEIVCTTKSAAGIEAAIAAVRGVAHGIPGCGMEVAVKTARPLWTPNAGDAALWETAREVLAEAGVEAGREMMFGGSDGNFTGALGVPTLDGLGAVGADAHQMTENIELASIVPRTRVMAGLLARLR